MTTFGNVFKSEQKYERYFLDKPLGKGRTAGVYSLKNSTSKQDESDSGGYVVKIFENLEFFKREQDVMEKLLVKLDFKR